MEIEVLEVGKKGQSQKKNPLLNLRYDKGWINLSAQDSNDLNKIKKGQILSISEPSQFGKTWYAFFNGFVTPEQGEQPEPDNNEDGRSLQWGEYVAVMREMHGVAKELEPDDAQARCALVNTTMIAFSHKLVSGPDKDDAPF